MLSGVSLTKMTDDNNKSPDSLSAAARNRYLKLIGVPDYLRGEFDYSAVAPVAVASAVARAGTAAPISAAMARKTGQADSGNAGAPAGARPARIDAPKKTSPPLPARNASKSKPAASAPPSRPKIIVPLSPESRWRPDLRKMACEGAPILREWRSADAPFTPEEHTLWTGLEQEVAGCKACPLHKGRRHTVFGDGSLAARLVLIGEGPGADEDFSGLPFVGRSGRLLTSMIDAAGFDRREVYICNTVKCRPPENRNPEPEEINACAGYLDRQLQLLRPQAILALGKMAAMRLLNSDSPVGQMRGQQHTYTTGDYSFPVFVSYHPSYLIRQGSQKQAAWEDIKLLIRFLTGH